MKVSSLLFYHGLVSAWYVFVLYNADPRTRTKGQEKLPFYQSYGKQWKYLTILNLVLQAVYFGCAALVDMSVLMKKYRIAKSMFSFRDLLFGSLAFPVSTFVFSAFWMLYYYDRKLVYPEDLDLVIPAWMNHGMHSTVFPLSLLDLLISPHRYPSKRKGLSFLTIASAAYIYWLLWVYFVTGKWAYPIFNHLSMLGTVAFFSVAAASLLFIYNMGEFLCRMIWGDSVVVLDMYKRKIK